MSIYCRLDNYSNVEEREVRHWIGKNLGIACGVEIDAAYLSQSPYRVLVYGSNVTPEFWQTVEETHTYDEESLTVTRNFNLVNVDIAEFAAHRKQLIAAARWEAQNAGITVEGFTVDTSSDTALMMLAVVQKAQVEPEIVVPWKTKEGVFVPLTATQLVATGNAIFGHIQSCFGIEGMRTIAIDSIVADEELSDTEKLTAINAITWSE